MIPRPLEVFFSRHPSVYARLLRWTGRGNLEKRVFLTLLRRGNVIFDIGANHGHFTRLFSDIAGPHGSVDAFEPNPVTYRALEQMIKSTAHFKNYRLHHSALGDKEGAATLYQPGNDDGQVSLRQHTHGSWEKPSAVIEHECKVARLDDEARPLTRLDFIKCDVEGAELPVLRGATETLARLSPVLFLEVAACWTQAFDYQPSDLVEFLYAAGYRHFYVADGSVRPFQRGQEIVGSVNLVCAKNDAVTHVLEA